MSNLLNLAEAAVEACCAAGSEWVDAVCLSYRDISVGVEKSSLRECETAREMGLGVRAYYRGGRGVAAVLGPTLAQARSCGRQAAEMALATHGDPDFVALPEPQPVGTVEDLFDEQVAGLSAKQAVHWCQQAIEESRSVAEDVLLSGGVDLSWGERALASSTGIRLETLSSRLSISFFAVIRQGGEVGTFYEFDLARRLADFQPLGVAEQATRGALKFLGARDMRTARMPVVLGPLSASALLGGLLGAATAESVQRNRSFLVGKCGEAVASDLLSICEDPLVPAGVRSTAADGEGVPKQKRILIDQGVLTTYLHNSYTANKAGVPNTAHAARSGYDAEVGIGLSNVSVEPGARTAAELIGEIEEGLYIEVAGMTADAVTGDLSATVDFGFKIEKGELAYPVKSTLIGGNLLDLVARIDAVSSDYRIEPGQIMPSLRISEVQVSSAG